MRSLISIFSFMLILFALITAIVLRCKEIHERTLNDTRFLNNK